MSLSNGDAQEGQPYIFIRRWSSCVRMHRHVEDKQDAYNAESEMTKVHEIICGVERAKSCVCRTVDVDIDHSLTDRREIYDEELDWRIDWWPKKWH